jgi:hypothetical protein
MQTEREAINEMSKNIYEIELDPRHEAVLIRKEETERMVKVDKIKELINKRFPQVTLSIRGGHLISGLTEEQLKLNDKLREEKRYTEIVNYDFQRIRTYIDAWIMLI